MYFSLISLLVLSFPDKYFHNFEVMYNERTAFQSPLTFVPNRHVTHSVYHGIKPDTTFMHIGFNQLTLNVAYKH